MKKPFPEEKAQAPKALALYEVLKKIEKDAGKVVFCGTFTSRIVCGTLGEAPNYSISLRKW